MQTAGLVLLVAVALSFDYTNGFHDAANAIAISVSTRALSPRVALALAAAANLVGALLATGVAEAVGQGIVSTPRGGTGLAMVFCALVGAIGWNLLTWYFGLPSSSSHALVGGLVGAAIVSAGTVRWGGVVNKVIVPMVVSPLVGLAGGYLVMLALLWLLRRARYRRVERGFRHGQIVSATFMAFSHGTQDAQKTMAVITLGLVTTGHLSSFTVPLWVIVAAASAISAGTFSGGWRVMSTLGRRIIHLDPAGGFAAEATASAVLLTAAYGYAVPVSTTHVVSSAVMGVGATRRLSAVRWGVAGNIVVAWILTLPAAAVIAALAYLLVDAVGL